MRYMESFPVAIKAFESCSWMMKLVNYHCQYLALLYDCTGDQIKTSLMPES